MASKVSVLKSLALTACDLGGHDMYPFKETPTAAKKEVHLSSCRNCQMTAFVDVESVDGYGGEAVKSGCDVTPALGMATYCVKVMLSQKTAQFVYIDSTSEKDAVLHALKMLRPDEPNNDDFAQVGVFITDHILHELGKGLYMTLRGEKLS